MSRCARPWRRRIAARAVVAALCAAPLLVARAAVSDDDILVDVQKHGQDIAVQIDCPVSAPLAIVWEVLTDYDHMAQFITTLDYSGVQLRVDNQLRVRQTGRVSYGLLTVPFENIRDIELAPYHQIHASLVSGGDLKTSETTTWLVEDAALVHIVSSGHYTSDAWIPPFLGPPVVETETRKRFGEIRDEILRRHARQNDSSPP